MEVEFVDAIVQMGSLKMESFPGSLRLSVKTGHSNGVELVVTALVFVLRHSAIKGHPKKRSFQVLPEFHAGKPVT